MLHSQMLGLESPWDLAEGSFPFALDPGAPPHQSMEHLHPEDLRSTPALSPPIPALFWLLSPGLASLLEGFIQIELQRVASFVWLLLLGKEHSEIIQFAYKLLLLLLVRSIPWCEWTSIYVSILLLVHIWVVFSRFFLQQQIELP